MKIRIENEVFTHKIADSLPDSLRQCSALLRAIDSATEDGVRKMERFYNYSAEDPTYHRPIGCGEEILPCSSKVRVNLGLTDYEVVDVVNVDGQPAERGYRSKTSRIGIPGVTSIQLPGDIRERCRNCGKK